jgi:hypothetical protein
VTTINVLRRIVANLGGNSDLPLKGVCSPPGGAHARGISSDREDSAGRAHACG